MVTIPSETCFSILMYSIEERKHNYKLLFRRRCQQEIHKKYYFHLQGPERVSYKELICQFPKIVFLL